MDGKLVIGLNRHREICTMQLSGNLLLLKDQIQRCVSIAVSKIVTMTEFIQTEISKHVPKLEMKATTCVREVSSMDEKMTMI